MSDPTADAPGDGTAPVADAPTAAGPSTSSGGVRRLTDADAKGGGFLRRRTSREGTDDEPALPESRPLWQNGAIVVGAFAGSTAIAEVAGAANLGTALSFGQIGFAIALVFVLVKR